MSENPYLQSPWTESMKSISRRGGRKVKEEEGSDDEREPTFTVTLDGIDEKYFKKRRKESQGRGGLR